jgi:acyl-coenzyme A thioesterase PaaI-like protein
MPTLTAVRAETFEWTGPDIGPRVETGMSGLAYLTALRDGTAAHPAIVRLVSAEFVELAPGRVQLICSASQPQFGLLREIDPGVAALLVNAAIGSATQTLVGLRQGWAIVASHASYIRPASPRVGHLIATADVVDVSNGSATVNGELTDDCGQVLITVTSTYEILDL